MSDLSDQPLPPRRRNHAPYKTSTLDDIVTRNGGDDAVQQQLLLRLQEQQQDSQQQIGFQPTQQQQQQLVAQQQEQPVHVFQVQQPQQPDSNQQFITLQYSVAPQFVQSEQQFVAQGQQQLVQQQFVQRQDQQYAQQLQQQQETFQQQQQQMQLMQQMQMEQQQQLQNHNHNPNRNQQYQGQHHQQQQQQQQQQNFQQQRDEFQQLQRQHFLQSQQQPQRLRQQQQFRQPRSNNGGGGGGGGGGRGSRDNADREHREQRHATAQQRVVPLTPAEGDAADARGCAIIDGLRKERKDAAVNVRVHELEADAVADVELSLRGRPALVQELCMHSRGVVVSHVLEVAGDDAGAGLFAVVARMLPQLTRSQSGCVALTRIYDTCAVGQRAALGAYVAANVGELALHPFGNYLVTRVIDTGDAAVMGAMAGQLADATTLTQLAGSKCASAIVERFLKQAPEDAALLVVAAVVSQGDVVAWIAADWFGNYVLQAALRRLFVLEGDTAQAVQERAVAVVPSAAAGSPFAGNIRHAMSKSKPQQQQQKQDEQQQQEQKSGDYAGDALLQVPEQLPQDVSPQRSPSHAAGSPDATFLQQQYNSFAGSSTTSLPLRSAQPTPPPLPS
jgi:hypothetical protein